MSIHPSLKSLDKDKKQRSVLKRTERLKIMLEKGDWEEGDRVFGLPKIKTVRIKIKKEKAKEVVEAAATEGTATEGTVPLIPETKEQTQGKGPVKAHDKKII